nr:methyltransferase-like protein 22 isoform X2 [Tanacetum cinerariifolium]
MLYQNTMQEIIYGLALNVDYIGGKFEHQVIDDSKQRQEVSLDDDGDLALPRRNKRSENKFVVAIQLNIASSIPKVDL